MDYTLKQPVLAADLCTKKLISKDPALVITVTARLAQLQVISEGAHELRASRRPRGSGPVGHGRPAAKGLQGRGGAAVLAATAGAVVVAPRRALRVRGAAPTAAAHLLNDVHLGPQFSFDVIQLRFR